MASIKYRGTDGNWQDLVIIPEMVVENDVLAGSINPVSGGAVKSYVDAMISQGGGDPGTGEDPTPVVCNVDYKVIYYTTTDNTTINAENKAKNTQTFLEIKDLISDGSDIKYIFIDEDGQALSLVDVGTPTDYDYTTCDIVFSSWTGEMEIPLFNVTLPGSSSVYRLKANGDLSTEIQIIGEYPIYLCHVNQADLIDINAALMSNMLFSIFSCYSHLFTDELENIKFSATPVLTYIDPANPTVIQRSHPLYYYPHPGALANPSQYNFPYVNMEFNCVYDGELVKLKTNLETFTIESISAGVDVLAEIASAEDVEVNAVKAYKENGAPSINITKENIIDASSLPNTVNTTSNTYAVISNDSPISDYFQNEGNEFTKTYYSVQKLSSFSIPDNIYKYVYTENESSLNSGRLDVNVSVSSAVVSEGSYKLTAGTQIVITPSSSLDISTNVPVGNISNATLNNTNYTNNSSVSNVIYVDQNNTKTINYGDVIPAGTYNVFLRSGVRFEKHGSSGSETLKFNEISITKFEVTTNSLTFMPDLNVCDISSDKFRYMTDKNKYVEFTKNGNFVIKNKNKTVEVNDNNLTLKSSKTAIRLNNDGELYMGLGLDAFGLNSNKLYKLVPTIENNMIYLTLSMDDSVDI